MHDFDYDAMEKKRIARGAIHMKRGSKSKKCSLPHDGLTAAQLRRLNGPVNTYKLDEPMDWKSFKAIPEDLKKQYITWLQDTYQANDTMLAKMFDVSRPTLLRMRGELGISVLEDRRLYAKDKEIRDAKWEAFCNGVVGGKPGAPVERSVEEPKEENVAEIEDEDIVKIDADEPIPGATYYIDDPVEVNKLKDMLDKVRSTIDIPEPDKLDVTFTHEIADVNDIAKMVQTLHIPTGKCRIRISIERC